VPPRDATRASPESCAKPRYGEPLEQSPAVERPSVHLQPLRAVDDDESDDDGARTLEHHLDLSCSRPRTRVSRTLPPLLPSLDARTKRT